MPSAANQETAIKNIASAIDDAGIIVVDFGLAAVGVATSIHEAWSVIETLVLGVTTTVAGAVDFVLEGWTLTRARRQRCLEPHRLGPDGGRDGRGPDANCGAPRPTWRRRPRKPRRASSGNRTSTRRSRNSAARCSTRATRWSRRRPRSTNTPTRRRKTPPRRTRRATSQQGLNDQVVPATEYTKQYVDAWEELNKTGVDYQATVDADQPEARRADPVLPAAPAPA